MKTGDAISFINENRKGKIVSINKQEAVILNEFGFEESVDVTEIILRDDHFYSKIPVLKKEESKNIRSKKNAKSELTLDLHFHHLEKNAIAYTAQQRLEIQREKLITMLNYCRINPIKKLEVIHGIGDGVLQKLVYDILESTTGIQYEDQNLFFESSGSVIVYFR